MNIEILYKYLKYAFKNNQIDELKRVSEKIL